VKRSGKASLLIFLLATIIALATLGCVAIVTTMLAQAAWCFAGSNDFCNLSEGGSDADDYDDMCQASRLFGLVVERL
jgi:hypothetical protein